MKLIDPRGITTGVPRVNDAGPKPASPARRPAENDDAGGAVVAVEPVPGRVLMFPPAAAMTRPKTPVMPTLAPMPLPPPTPPGAGGPPGRLGGCGSAGSLRAGLCEGLVEPGDRPGDNIGVPSTPAHDAAGTTTLPVEWFAERGVEAKPGGGAAVCGCSASQLLLLSAAAEAAVAAAAAEVAAPTLIVNPGEPMEPDDEEEATGAGAALEAAAGAALAAEGAGAAAGAGAPPPAAAAAAPRPTRLRLLRLRPAFPSAPSPPALAPEGPLPLPLLPALAAGGGCGGPAPRSCGVMPTSRDSCSALCGHMATCSMGKTTMSTFCGGTRASRAGHGGPWSRPCAAGPGCLPVALELRRGGGWTAPALLLPVELPDGDGPRADPGCRDAVERRRAGTGVAPPPPDSVPLPAPVMDSRMGRARAAGGSTALPWGAALLSRARDSESSSGRGVSAPETMRLQRWRFSTLRQTVPTRRLWSCGMCGPESAATD